MMAFDDSLQLFRVYRALLNKLQNAGVILGASCAQCYRGQMLGCHNPGADIFYRRWDCLSEGFEFQFIVRRKKLYRPPAKDDVFVFHGAASELQVVINRSEAKQPSTRNRR